MKRLILLITILSLSTISCAWLTQRLNPETPAPPSTPTNVEIAITEEPAPAATDTAEPPAPTITPTPVEKEQFFTEEFDEPLSEDWKQFVTTEPNYPDTSKTSVEVKKSRLVWDFNNKYIAHYKFYTAFTYSDVKVELAADNRGRNNNNVTLVCRYDPAVGWYEANASSNGTYLIAFAEILDSGKIAYHYLSKGASLEIKQGKEHNEYSFTCSGNEFSFFANGQEIKTIPDKEFGLREGGVGIGIGTGDVLPILVEMDWFKVSQP